MFWGVQKVSISAIEKKYQAQRIEYQVTSEPRRMGCFGERKEVFEVRLMLLTGRQSINTRVGLI